MAQTTLGLEYSAFFSSGLLAQHKRLNSWATHEQQHSPSRASSPIPVPTDDSFMDIDMASCDDQRSVTPTPQSKTPIQSPQPVKSQQPSTPRLRKRRSSLTQPASPISAIRSPIRTTANALHLQRQLYTAVGSVSSRSRSSSVSGEDGMISRFTNAGVASSENSLGGRLRSGSFGCAPPAPVPLRRRPLRRLHISALQAPLAPPPTIPLPALPSAHPDQQRFRPTNINTRITYTKVPSSSPASATSARARGLSVSSSALDGDANKIDEEMKEN